MPPKAILAAIFLGAAVSAHSETLTSPTYDMRPAWQTAGGQDDCVSASDYRLGGAVGDVIGPRMYSPGYALGSGLRQIMAYPGVATNISAAADLQASSVTLTCDRPGYDGDVGALQAGSSFFMVLATYTTPSPFALANFDILVPTETVTAAVTVGTGTVGLLPNNTYYAHLWTADADGNVSYISARATYTMLAKVVDVLPDPFLRIDDTSITVNWVGLKVGPPEASSATSEGFLLEASDTADFSSVVFSSRTDDPRVSTLTVGDNGTPLAYCTTYYFRVASLNWVGAKNYLLFPATPTYNDSAVQVSTHDLDIGVSTIATTVVISTSFLVANTGNCPITFDLGAATATTGSPWVIAAVPDMDALTLSAGFNADQPALGDFGPEDAMTVAPAASDATKFAIGQTGAVVPRGASRLLWFKLGMPTITSTEDPQDLQITVRSRSLGP